MPVTENSCVPNTAPPCLPQASSWYSAGATVLTQNSCWGQTHRHLKYTPDVMQHGMHHPRCAWGCIQPWLDTPLSRIYCHTSLRMQGQTKVTKLWAQDYALFLNNSPFWWTAPGHNNASLCNCNKDLKTSLDAVFPLLKHPPRIYLLHALLFPCTWNDSMEIRTNVYKMKEIYIPFSLSTKFWFSFTAVIPNCCILLWNLFNSLSHLAKHQLIQHNLLQILGICYGSDVLP